jgi:hypothetical protein
MPTPTSITSGDLRVANRGRVLAAPKGSVVPTDTTTAWDAAWSDLGYCDEKGVTFSKKDSKTAIKAWQSISPVRYILTDRDIHLAFVMEQWNKKTLAVYSNEGLSAVVANGSVSGEYKLSFTPNPKDQEFMLGVEWSDDVNTITHRVVCVRGSISDTADIPLNHAGLATLGVTYQTMATDAVTDLVTLLMKDPSMAP